MSRYKVGTDIKLIKRPILTDRQFVEILSWVLLIAGLIIAGWVLSQMGTPPIVDGHI